MIEEWCKGERRGKEVMTRTGHDSAKKKKKKKEEKKQEPGRQVQERGATEPELKVGPAPALLSTCCCADRPDRHSGSALLGMPIGHP